MSKKKIVVIADIVSSKRIIDRALIQKKLEEILERLNNRKDSNLVSPYTITIGDEFQAVFNDAETLFYDAILILSSIYPEQIRFCFSVGTIATPINPERAIGMDGPAFHNARKAIEELKATPYLFNVVGIKNSNINLAKQGLLLISHTLRTWKKSRFQVLAMLYENLPVKEIAEKIQLSDKAVYKTIDAGALRIIVRLFGETTKLINESLEDE